MASHEYLNCDTGEKKMRERRIQATGADIKRLFAVFSG